LIVLLINEIKFIVSFLLVPINSYACSKNNTIECIFTSFTLTFLWYSHAQVLCTLNFLKAKVHRHFCSQCYYTIWR